MSNIICSFALIQMRFLQRKLIVFLIIITLNMETPIPLLRTVSTNSTNKNIPNIIKDILLELEKEYKFSVVFCSEVSSHTWGLNHKDSDWDVKFIFAYPNSTYFSPNEPILEIT